ncbi:MAG: hypothetical protein VYE03_03245, partial [Nitrospinota bacterium]|nr:hypothetical protein [Nitrospinota bacterium]
MKITNSILIAVSMIFLFSAPQKSIALKHSPNIITNKKQNNISQENLANIIIAQAKRPGPPGKMSGQRREPSSNRGPELGNKRLGKPFQGNDRQRRMKRRGAGRQGMPMDQNGDKPPTEAGGGSGVSEVQSDQGTGEIAPDSKRPNRGSKFRKKMRKARRNKMRQRMKRRGAGRQGMPMGQNGDKPPTEAGGGSGVSEVQSDQGTGEIAPDSKRP